MHELFCASVWQGKGHNFDCDWYQDYSHYCLSIYVCDFHKFGWKSQFLLCVFSGFFHHSTEELWIVACFHSACSSSIPSRTLHWRRQTSLLICWTPPFPSYPTGKLKQDRKTDFFYFHPVSLLCPLCTAAPDSPAVIQNFWHMHRLYANVFLSVCLCVLAALMCGAWVFYNMFNITPQGLATQTTTLTMRGEREMEGSEGRWHWTISAE